MSPMQKLVLAVTAILLFGLLAGCGTTTVEIGMQETTQPGHWQASYVTFSGTKSQGIQASAGQTLVLDYQAKVEKGSLTLEIQDASKDVLWDVTLYQSAGETVQLPVYQDGRYTVVVRGNETGGSFDLSWQLQ